MDTYVCLVLFKVRLGFFKVLEKHLTQKPIRPHFLPLFHRLLSPWIRNEFWLIFAVLVVATYLFSLITCLVLLINCQLKDNLQGIFWVVFWHSLDRLPS